MATNKDRFIKLVSEKDTTLLEDIIRRIKYRKYYRFMFNVKIRWFILKDKLKKIW